MGKSIKNRDKDILISIVKEMANSKTGIQSTKHWAKDALWFDIPPFASRGIQPAVKMFDSVFSRLNVCDDRIVEWEAVVEDKMGVVCSVHQINLVFKDSTTMTAMVRQTNCFRKDEIGKWSLIHQHASIPHGGDWDGEIISA